jgi:hypothetical protein
MTLWNFIPPIWWTHVLSLLALPHLNPAAKIVGSQASKVAAFFLGSTYAINIILYDFSIVYDITPQLYQKFSIY